MAWTVWTVTGHHRAKRDAAAGSGTSVLLFAARRQPRGFQVLMRADAQVSNVNFTEAALTDPDGHTIPAANIHVQRAQQIEVTTETYQNPLDTTTLEGTGWYADGLVPSKHPVTGATLAPGATYQAVPFTLPANQTHTFWVDVTVPANAVPGVYTGTLTVSADGETDVAVTITMTVYSFPLPETPALRTALWKGTVDTLYGYRGAAQLNWTRTQAQWEGDITSNVNTVLSEHGIAAQPFHIPTALNFKPEPNDALGGPYAVTAAEIAALQTHIDTYHPSTIYLQHPDTAGGPFNDPAGVEAVAYAAWVAAYATGILAVDRRAVTYAVYNKDEPTTAVRCQEAIDFGEPLVDGDVHSMITGTIAVPDSYPTMISMIGAASIWAVPLDWYYDVYDIGGVAGQWTYDAVTTRLAAGETIWLYTALSGNATTGLRPFLQLDRPLVNYRLQSWFAWQGNMTGWLYWASGIWWETIFAKPDDPWTDPETHSSHAGTRVYNSEGSLLYPADDTSIGFYGVVPSMRLKALRDGINDYSYFALAARLGLEDEADAVVDGLITDFTAWDLDPDAYDRALAGLAALIDAAWILATRPAAEVFNQGREPHRDVFKDGSVTNLARITGSEGLPITRAQFVLGDSSSSSSGEDSRAYYTLYLLDDQDSDNKTPVTGHENVALDINQIIFDTLQTDGLWDEDSRGYNFRHTIDISSNPAFAIAGRSYQAEYRLTPTGGQVVIVRFQLLAA
jgi:hypothetical protein